jgi:hypothetical protein
LKEGLIDEDSVGPDPKMISQTTPFTNGAGVVFSFVFLFREPEVYKL